MKWLSAIFREIPINLIVEFTRIPIRIPSQTRRNCSNTMRLNKHRTTSSICACEYKWNILYAYSMHANTNAVECILSKIELICQSYPWNFIELTKKHNPVHIAQLLRTWLAIWPFIWSEKCMEHRCRIKDEDLNRDEQQLVRKSMYIFRTEGCGRIGL